MYDFLRRLPDSLDVTKASKPATREYYSVIRNVARTACLICNKIKHNDYVLGRRDNYYPTGFYVEGFVLLSRGRDASYEISRDLHDAEKPGMSFNLGIRALLFDFLRADIAAGHLCSVLGAGEAEMPDSDLMNVLRVLNSRPEIGLDFERAHTIPAMWEQPGFIVAGMKVRNLPFLGNKVLTRHFFRGDGYTKTFPVP